MKLTPKSKFPTLKKKKKKYYFVTLDSGKRKRFKVGTFPSYEHSDSEGEYF